MIMPKILHWLINNFPYHTVIFVKDALADIASLILGLLLCLILVAFVLKNTVWVPDAEAEFIKITKMKKIHYRITIIVPKDKYLKLSSVTVLVVLLKSLLVRFLPIKHLEVVDNKVVRITTTVFVICIILLCIFNISFDTNSILPNHHGGYSIYNIMDDITKPAP
jgi:hypothetical protein